MMESTFIEAPPINEIIKLFGLSVQRGISDFNLMILMQIDNAATRKLFDLPDFVL